jgi:hypothetical protein
MSVLGECSTEPCERVVGLRNRSQYPRDPRWSTEETLRIIQSLSWRLNWQVQYLEQLVIVI